ncbi:TolC family protein [Flavisolibacter ginsenosidimutans]|uniref:TolC family protein n=1 Tax=Flavisolibacter ginsenosidimutans TaxID=661481 RepID=A0A5B8UK94_9BACT|nr:TolC family protein [Flavisolibacter ginsenosidimutans]QEC57117.1 TolC family protein [Flavisolibacter ginsenosidimutans]
MTRLVSFVFLSLVASSSQAQSQSDSLLPSATVDQCIRYALTHQPIIQQAGIDEQLTDLSVRNRLADWYPQIGANYSLQHNFQRQTSFFNGVATPVGATNTSAAQLYLNQSIFNRDVLLARSTQGDVRLQARQATESRKIDVVAGVSKAYYDVLTTRQQIQVANENIARLQKSLNDAYYRYTAGVTDKTDYKRAQITLNNTTATKQANEAALKAKVEYLKNLMGYPVNEPLNVVYDSLQMEREVAFDTLQMPEYARRIEYSQLATQRRLQEANVLYQRNAFLPNVSATAGYNFNFLNNNFGKLYANNYPNSFVGLTASVPIFQGGKRKINVRSAQLQLTRTDLDILNLKNAINSQFATALGNYKANLANYNASKANVALAQEVYDVIQLQYKAGVKTYLEVITSEADLRTAQINYFNALYQVLAAKVDAERALGTLAY